MDEPLLPQGTQALFPIKAERAYLDNAAIAPMSLPVIAAVDAFMADVRDFGRNNYPDWCRRAGTEVKERIGTPGSFLNMLSTKTERSWVRADRLEYPAGRSRPRRALAAGPFARKPWLSVHIGAAAGSRQHGTRRRRWRCLRQV